MSILIKGMEMPRTCRDCCLSTFTDFDSMPFCNITMDDICLNDWETKRCDNCPLVPVPPHGDLIDRRDAIIDANERAYDFWLSDDEVNVTIQFLKEQPTTIPASEEGEA